MTFPSGNRSPRNPQKECSALLLGSPKLWHTASALPSASNQGETLSWPQQFPEGNGTTSQ